jgi:hypothetical protein
MYAWLLAATRRPVAAIATYDAEAALRVCLAFGRAGISTSHFRVLAAPGKARKCSAAMSWQEPAAGPGLDCLYLDRGRKSSMSNLVLRLIALRPGAGAACRAAAVLLLLHGAAHCAACQGACSSAGNPPVFLLLQAQTHGSCTSASGSTYGADSEDEFNAQLAEEGSAPDADAQLTASLLGALHQPDMTIGVAPMPVHRTWS